MKSIITRLKRNKLFHLSGRNRIVFILVILVAVILSVPMITFAYSKSAQSDTKSTAEALPPARNEAPVKVLLDSSKSDAVEQVAEADQTIYTSSNSNEKIDYRPFICQNVTISYDTEYVNQSSMATGQTETISQGLDGYYISCTPDSNGYRGPLNGTRIESVSSVVFVGTGLTQEQVDQAKAARDQRYYLALANCIQNLKNSGVSESQVSAACNSQVQY